MLITTTATLQERQIRRYFGLVSGEAILGANVFRDFFAEVRDIVGGRSAAYERELRRAKQIALDEMSAQTRQLGANAVIGVDLDYETIGGEKVSGTNCQLRGEKVSGTNCQLRAAPGRTAESVSWKGDTFSPGPPQPALAGWLPTRCRDDLGAQ